VPNAFPVVLVHGLLGFGPKELGPVGYWGTALKVPSALPRFEASVGPLGSAHDRACELAAQVRGAPVDYGAAHARREGHERFGRDFTGRGFVPEWSERKPVHLVGHSLGSPTIRCLQHLLAIDYWRWGSNERWVSSITTISGASNGSTLTYLFGADPKTGLMRKQSLATGLVLAVEAYAFATGGIQEDIYNFDLDHWGFTRNPGETLADYLGRVSRSRFIRGKDNALYSLTLQGAYADNGEWKTWPATYYFSNITEQTERTFLSGRHYPRLRMNPALLAHAIYIGQKEFDRPPLPVTAFNAADWWENDGAVSTHSQKYPHISGDHPVGGEFTAATGAGRLRRGRWYYQWEREMDHLDICICPEPGQIGRQRRFFVSLFERLARLKR
jgi:triacylglycerol esterase/lipase EstA (alpha/beta hydrolase family)